MMEFEEKDMNLHLPMTIGYFYLLKNEQDYQKTYKEIHDMFIHEVSFKEIDDFCSSTLQVTIRLERPGLLIGCKGKNIQDLENHLSEEFKKKVSIRIVEEKYLGYLYPTDWNDRMRYWESNQEG